MIHLDQLPGLAPVAALAVECLPAVPPDSFMAALDPTTRALLVVVIFWSTMQNRTNNRKDKP